MQVTNLMMKVDSLNEHTVYFTTENNLGKTINAYQSNPSNSPDPFKADVSCIDHCLLLISGSPSLSETCCEFSAPLLSCLLANTSSIASFSSSSYQVKCFSNITLISLNYKPPTSPLIPVLLCLSVLCRKNLRQKWSHPYSGSNTSNTAESTFVLRDPKPVTTILAH